MSGERPDNPLLFLSPDLLRLVLHDSQPHPRGPRYIINGRGESSISHDLNFAEPRQIPRKVTLHRNDHG